MFTRVLITNPPCDPLKGWRGICWAPLLHPLHTGDPDGDRIAL